MLQVQEQKLGLYFDGVASQWVKWGKVQELWQVGIEVVLEPVLELLCQLSLVLQTAKLMSRIDHYLKHNLYLNL